MYKELLTEKRDNRDLERLEDELLDVLEAELNFVEKGGYGRSVRAPSTPMLVFQDSPSCLCFPVHDHDDTCMLMRFVPPQSRLEDLPCHHIPLSPAGETIELLERTNDQEAIENAVKRWLREKIADLQRERTETGFVIT